MRFSALFCALLALPLLPQASHAANFELTIVHANDTHSAAAGIDGRYAACREDDACTGGYARIVEAVEALRKENPAVLALDAGDFWQGTHFFRTGGPEWALAAMKRMPWDAVTLGNHEFDAGCAETVRYVENLPMPVVAANILPNPKCPMSRAPLKPYVVKTVGGVRVGVVGLANDEGKEVSAACPATTFADRAEALRKAVSALEKEGVRHIVALTHVGYKADVELARAVPDIDVIVGGHTHSVLGNHPDSEGPYPTVVKHPNGNETLVVQAGRSTRYLGVIKVRFDEAGRVTGYTGDLTELTPAMPRDDATETFVRRSGEAVEKERKRVLATNEEHFYDGLDDCREGECLSGMWTADALLDWGRRFGAEAAFINGGALRAPLPIGPVTHADILDLHPFGNHAAVVAMPGRVILAALEHGLSEPDLKSPRLLQTAGLRYRVNPAQPIGSRVAAAEIRENGRWLPIEGQKTYRIATTAYLLDGGDQFGMLKNLPPAIARGPLEATLLEDLLEKRRDEAGKLPLPETGRIVGMPFRDDLSAKPRNF